MAVPSNRSEFKEYCLRRLGKGAIKINVTDDQVDDRVDEALTMFRDYHFDGTLKTYLKHQLTQQDIDNKYIDITDPTIIDVVKMFDVTGLVSGASMFDIRYQIALNDLYTLTQQTMVPFFMTMQHLSLLEMLLKGSPPIRFNRFESRIFLDTDLKKLGVGMWIVFQVYQVTDPEAYALVWADRWLQRYTCALIKEQWGTNLGKMTIQLPGNITYNGTQLYEQAVAEKEELEEKMINDYSLPLDFEIG